VLDEDCSQSTLHPLFDPDTKKHWIVDNKFISGDYSCRQEFYLYSWNVDIEGEGAVKEEITDFESFGTLMSNGGYFIYKSELYLCGYVAESKKVKEMKEGEMKEEEEEEIYLNTLKALSKVNLETRQWTRVLCKGNEPVNAMDYIVHLFGSKLFAISKLNHELFVLDLNSLVWTYIQTKEILPYVFGLTMHNDYLCILGINRFNDLSGYGALGPEAEFLVAYKPGTKEMIKDEEEVMKKYCRFYDGLDDEKMEAKANEQKEKIEKNEIKEEIMITKFKF